MCVVTAEKIDCYGYEISEYLSKHIDIADGTVYPILRELEKSIVYLHAGRKRRSTRNTIPLQTLVMKHMKRKGRVFEICKK